MRHGIRGGRLIKAAPPYFAKVVSLLKTPGLDLK